MNQKSEYCYLRREKGTVAAMVARNESEVVNLGLINFFLEKVFYPFVKNESRPLKMVGHACNVIIAYYNMIHILNFLAINKTKRRKKKSCREEEKNMANFVLQVPNTFRSFTVSASSNPNGTSLIFFL